MQVILRVERIASKRHKKGHPVARGGL